MRVADRRALLAGDARGDLVREAALRPGGRDAEHRLLQAHPEPRGDHLPLLRDLLEAHGDTGRVPPAGAFSLLELQFCNFLQNFANFSRARSRLYRSRFLQVNIRVAAFFKIYKMCTLMHRSKFNILTKIRF